MMDIVKSILGLAILISLPMTAIAKSPEKIAAMFESLATGPTMKSEHEEYRLVPTGLVERMEEGDQVSANGDAWAARLGQYRISIDANAKKTKSATSSKYLLAYNARTKALGVVTGKIVVEVYERESIVLLEKAHNLLLSSDFGHIGYAYYQVRPNVSLQSSLLQLQSDSRVKSAYLDILEREKVER